jgi:hypothetical protein
MPDKLPQVRSKDAVLFPAPEDGERLDITPPPLYWLQVQGATEYRVVIELTDGTPVVERTVMQNYLLLRDPLSAGDYRWNLYSAEDERGWQTFTISEDALEHVVPTADEVLAQIPPTHPRHIYYPEDVEGIVARYPQAQAVLKRNIRAAIEQGMPPRPRFHRTDGEYASHPRYREAFGEYRDYVDRNLVACALGHLLCKQADAAEYARTAFLEIMDWNPEGPCAVDGPWGDEIGLSNARCLFAVYDWTHDLYTEEQHGYIHATLTQYARQILRLLKRRNFFNDPGNNHSGRIPAYLGEAALVLHGHVDPVETREWLQCALDVYGSFFPHFGGRDGGWAQGTFYGSSYTKWYLPFFFALERHTGFSFLDRPFYRNLSHFYMHFSPPGWETHPFCDGYWCHPEDEEWPGFFAQNPYGVYAERFGPDVARAFNETVSDPELFKLHLMDVFRPAYASARADGAGKAEQSRAFRDAGFVSMHSRIEDPAEDTAVLVRASKFGTVSHMHADHGNFAIISRGKGLVTPSGYFGRSAGTTHHRGWTLQTVAHNCVLVDGVGQRAGRFDTVGHIVSLDDSGPVAFTRLDLAGAYPMLQSYSRLVFLFRPNVVVVCDDLVSPIAVPVSWLLHTLSPPKEETDRVSVYRDPASLGVQLFTAPDDLSFSFTDRHGIDPNEGEPVELHRHQPKQYHLTWETGASARRRFVGVLAVNGAEAFVKKTGTRVRVEYEDQTLDIELDPEAGALAHLNGTQL